MAWLSKMMVHSPSLEAGVRLVPHALPRRFEQRLVESRVLNHGVERRGLPGDIATSRLKQEVMDALIFELCASAEADVHVLLGGDDARKRGERAMHLLLYVDRSTRSSP